MAETAETRAVVFNMGRRSFFLESGEFAPGASMELAKTEAERLSKMYPGEIRIAAELPAKAARPSKGR